MHVHCALARGLLVEWAGVGLCGSRRTGCVQMFTLQGALVAIKGTSWYLISTIWTR